MKPQQEIYVDPKYHLPAQEVRASVVISKAALAVGAELFGVQEHRHEWVMIDRIKAQLFQNAREDHVTLFEDSITIFQPREGKESWQLTAVGWGCPA